LIKIKNRQFFNVPVNISNDYQKASRRIDQDICVLVANASVAALMTFGNFWNVPNHGIFLYHLFPDCLKTLPFKIVMATFESVYIFITCSVLYMEFTFNGLYLYSTCFYLRRIAMV